MNDQAESGFKWPCGHQNRSGAQKCEVCDMELLTIGIDLGTTSSLGAICQQADPRPPFQVKFSEHQLGVRITPSVVSLDKENGKLLVGAEAVENLFQDPANTVFSIKRMMGKQYNDEDIQRLMTQVEYQIVKGEGGMAAVKLGGRIYTPTELSAEILKRIKEDAERHFGRVITHAVITVPANFSDIQRRATLDAGRMAGFFVKRLISEPVAAAYSYGYGLNPAKPIRLLVFDMGGGTFDVSIMRLASRIDVAIRHKGDMWLGGDDVDQSLTSEKTTEIERKYGVDLTQYPCLVTELRQKIKEAKERICSPSGPQECALRLVNYLQTDEGHVRVENLKLNREEVQKACSPLVDEAISLVKASLVEARMSAKDIDKVILVGGSARLLGIQHEMGQLFAVVEDIQSSTDAIALGAAVLARRIKGMHCSEGHKNEPTAVKCAECGEELEPFIDRTSQNYGIEVLGGQFEVVLPKGTLCPTTKPVIRTFLTTHPSQRRIRIPIYQGDKESAKDNAWQGEIDIELDMGVGVDTHVDVYMNMNKNTILEVRAECAGESKSAMIAPINWVRSLNEKVQQASDGTPERDTDMAKLTHEGSQILRELEKTDSLDSAEAESIGQRGREVLAELESLERRKELLLYTQLFRQMLRYRKIFDDITVEKLQTASDACQSALARGDDISKEQAEKKYMSAFERIFRYDRSNDNEGIVNTIFIMVMIREPGSLDADIRKVSLELDAVDKQIWENDITGASKRVLDVAKAEYFRRIEGEVFRTVKLPGLVKPKRGYGQDVDTRPVVNI